MTLLIHGNFRILKWRYVSAICLAIWGYSLNLHTWWWFIPGLAGSWVRGLELTPVFLIGAFYVGNGWVVGVAGMIITSDEMDHARKFPAFSTSKFLSGPTLLPFPIRVISPTSRDERWVVHVFAQLPTPPSDSSRLGPRGESRKGNRTGFLGIPNGHFLKLKNGEFK
jgi:hypothetical protein